MDNVFFPPDVKVVLAGDKEAADALQGAARSVLFKALNRNNNEKVPFSLTSELLDGGGSIKVLLAGDLKIVTITVSPPPVEIPPPVFPPPELEGDLITIMLSGWIRKSTLANHQEYLEFCPTPACARTHVIPAIFAANKKLGVGSVFAETPDLLSIRPGSYSGAMKRVVQAVLGLGIITDNSPEYISGLPSSPQKRTVKCTYGSSAGMIHGIYKAAAKNHWLIEISKANGIMAMPLPLIASTSGAAYLERVSRNDLGTRNVLKEFGGLPSGESFPTDSVKLAAAIASGKIIQLLDASAFTEFNKGEDAGWAFSDSGARVTNTTFRTEPATDPLLYLVNDFKGRLWEIGLSLTKHNVANLLLKQPIGSGSVSLDQIHVGRIDANNGALLYYKQGGFLVAPLDGGGASGYTRQANNPAGGWGAYVYSFFIGEYLHTVRYVQQPPPVIAGNKTYLTVPPGDMTCRVQGSFPAAIRVDIKAVWSPSAFVGTDFDPRHENINGGWNLNSYCFTDAEYASIISLYPQISGDDPGVPPTALYMQSFNFLAMRGAREAYMIDVITNLSPLVPTEWEVGQVTTQEVSQYGNVQGGVISGVPWRPAFGLPLNIQNAPVTSQSPAPNQSSPWYQGWYFLQSFGASIAAGAKPSGIYDRYFSDLSASPPDSVRFGLPAGCERSLTDDINYVGSI